MTEQEVRAIADSIVKKAKATARVDQGTLKRSIAFTYVKQKVTFRQIYYGDYNDNSLLESLAKKYMPKGVPYNIELTEFGGKTFEKGVTKEGRATQKNAIKQSKNTTSNIRKLIQTVKKQREKDGEEKNE